MDDEAKKLLLRLAVSNERTAECIEKILSALTKPHRPEERIFAFLGAGAAAGGVMSAIDLIIKWLGG